MRQPSGKSEATQRSAAGSKPKQADRTWLWTLILAVVGIGAGFVATFAWLKATEPPVVTTREYSRMFSRGGTGTTGLVRGWSQSENWGTWSEGQQAELTWRLDATPRGDAIAKIDARSFSPAGKRGKQSVRVTVNGTHIKTLLFNSDEQVVDGTFTIPGSLLMRSQPLRVVFDIAEPASHLDTKIGTDPRKIGLGLVRMTLRYEPAEIIQY